MTIGHWMGSEQRVTREPIGTGTFHLGVGLEIAGTEASKGTGREISCGNETLPDFPLLLCTARSLTTRPFPTIGMELWY